MAIRLLFYFGDFHNELKRRDKRSPDPDSGDVFMPKRNPSMTVQPCPGTAVQDTRRSGVCRIILYISLIYMNIVIQFLPLAIFGFFLTLGE